MSDLTNHYEEAPELLAVEALLARDAARLRMSVAGQRRVAHASSELMQPHPMEVLLDEDAAGLPVPGGLTDRVFEASVSLLTGPRQVARPHDPGRHLRVGRSVWRSPLAMAAVMGLAFVVGSRMLQSPDDYLAASPVLEALFPIGDDPLEDAIVDASSIIELGDAAYDITYDDIESDFAALESALHAMR